MATSRAAATGLLSCALILLACPEATSASAAPYLDFGPGPDPVLPGGSATWRGALVYPSGAGAAPGESVHLALNVSAPAFAQVRVTPNASRFVVPDSGDALRIPVEVSLNISPDARFPVQGSIDVTARLSPAPPSEDLLHLSAPILVKYLYDGRLVLAAPASLDLSAGGSRALELTLVNEGTTALGARPGRIELPPGVSVLLVPEVFLESGERRNVTALLTAGLRAESGRMNVTFLSYDPFGPRTADATHVIEIPLNLPETQGPFEGLGILVLEGLLAVGFILAAYAARPRGRRRSWLRWARR